MSTNPPPTTLVLLKSLLHCKFGTKVRFLGCVENYYTSTATLVLFHNFPAAPLQIRARVNIDLLLSSLKQEDTTVGEWLNVIGYVNDNQNFNSKNQVAKSAEIIEVKIQAIMIWSAGTVKLADYERVLQQRENMITDKEYK